MSALIGRDDVIGAFRAVLAGSPLDPICRLRIHDDGFNLHLHPVAEEVFVRVDGEYMTLEAKTSCVGPGYHAFLVSCLDAIEADLGLAWEWDSGDPQWADETGYAQRRDFTALQQEMAAYRKYLYASILENDDLKDAGTVRLSMPSEFDPRTSEKYLTALGPLSTADLKALAANDSADLTDAVRPLFAWWEEGYNADFYRGLALYGLWMDVRWSAPIDEIERDELLRVLEWCDLAEQLGAEPGLPKDAVSTLRTLAAQEAPSVLPKQEGIGYLRRSLTRNVTGHWYIDAPGSLLETTEDDGQTVVLWNDELVVRGSSLTANTRSDMSEDLEPRAEIVRHIEFGPSSSGEGFEMRVTAETIRQTGTVDVGILTIWIEREGLRSIASAIANSLTYRCLEPTPEPDEAGPGLVAANEND